MNNLWASVTRLGDFWKFLVAIFKKVAQIISNFLGYFEKPHSYVKTAVATSWVILETIGLLFKPTSGHTGLWVESIYSVRRRLVDDEDFTF